MGHLGILGWELRGFCSAHQLAPKAGPRKADLVVSEKPESRSLVVLVITDQTIISPDLK
jgi:hypothetical protein